MISCRFLVIEKDRVVMHGEIMLDLQLTKGGLQSLDKHWNQPDFVGGTASGEKDNPMQLGPFVSGPRAVRHSKHRSGCRGFWYFGDCY